MMGIIQRYIKDFLDFVIKSQIYISLGAVSFALMSAIFLNIDLNPPIAFIIFSEFFFIYNLNRITDTKEDGVNTPERLKFAREYKIIFYLSIILFLVSLILAFLIDLVIFAIVVVGISLGVIYSVGGLPHSIASRTSYKRLKEVPLIKNIVVSFVWASVVLSLATYNNINWGLTVWIIFLLIFIRIFIGCIVFDVRDVEGDIINNIHTIPIIYGVVKTKKILYIMNTLSAIFIFSMVFYKLLPSVAHITNLVTIYAYYFIYKINKKDTDIKHLCDVVVDGEYILASILTLFGGSVKYVVGF